MSIIIISYPLNEFLHDVLCILLVDRDEGVVLALDVSAEGPGHRLHRRVGRDRTLQVVLFLSFEGLHHPVTAKLRLS